MSIFYIALFKNRIKCYRTVQSLKTFICYLCLPVSLQFLLIKFRYVRVFVCVCVYVKWLVLEMVTAVGATS
jgi:hypothetical protein